MHGRNVPDICKGCSLQANCPNGVYILQNDRPNVYNLVSYQQSFISLLKG